MRKTLLILLCLPLLLSGQNWEAIYIGCSQNEIKKLMNYLNTVDQNTLDKITKKKRQGKKIKKKEKIILANIKQLDPNSLFNLNKNIDKQIKYLNNLSPEECTQNCLNNYLYKNLKYPDKLKNASIEGKIYVSYTINVEGSVTDVKVIFGEKENKQFKEEAKRLISSLPKFKPAKKRGKAISTQYTIPIEFILN